MEKINKSRKTEILDISNILTDRDKRMLKNVGYTLLSASKVKNLEETQSFNIKKRDDVLFLQLEA